MPPKKSKSASQKRTQPTQNLLDELHSASAILTAPQSQSQLPEEESQTPSLDVGPTQVDLGGLEDLLTDDDDDDDDDATARGSTLFVPAPAKSQPRSSTLLVPAPQLRGAMATTRAGHKVPAAGAPVPAAKGAAATGQLRRPLQPASTRRALEFDEDDVADAMLPPSAKKPAAPAGKTTLADKRAAAKAAPKPAAKAAAKSGKQKHVGRLVITDAEADAPLSAPQPQQPAPPAAHADTAADVTRKWGGAAAAAVPRSPEDAAVVAPTPPPPMAAAAAPSAAELRFDLRYDVPPHTKDKYIEMAHGGVRPDIRRFAALVAVMARASVDHVREL